MTSILRRITLVAAVMSTAAASVTAAEVWLEAEAADRGNFPPPEENPFRPTTPGEADKLSGGEWVGVTGNPSDKFLEFDVEVPEAGTYRLYTRKFWKHGPYRWRVTQDGDASAWTDIDRSVGLLDASTLRTHTVANWTGGGEVALDEGPATLRIEVTADQGAAAFDAFLLTKEVFVPRGRLRPGEKYGDSLDIPDGWFAFEPPADGKRQPLVDLSSLNEDEAGSMGFIATNGDRFVHSDSGETVRFWAVNAGPDVWNMDRASIDHLAKFLARRGVNLVRLHGATYSTRGDLAERTPERIDAVHYFVAALKKEGIYATLSIYFPLWTHPDADHGFPGYDGKTPPFALLFFNPEFQEIYRGWWRDLMLPDNPYTGIPLAEDPAVATVELANEDSFFFWTFVPGDRIPGEQIDLLEGQWEAWLIDKYGSLEEARKDWKGDKSITMPPVSAFVFQRKNPKNQDAAEFLAETKRTFYEGAVRFLRDDIGFQGLVSASNWTTADASILEPLEKWAYLAGDFTDRHGYYSGIHRGDGANHSVREGHVYGDRAAVRFDAADPMKRGEPAFEHPLMNAVYGGEQGLVPSMISEVDWAQPNRFRADQTLIGSAYALLQGLDAPVWFAVKGPTWLTQVDKWPLMGPDTVGQFPAMAMLYRRGLVQEGPVAASMTAAIGPLKRLQGAPAVGKVSLDALRMDDVPEGQTAPTDAQSIDPRAFFVGKVLYQVVEGDQEPVVEMMNLAEHTDESAGVITSATDELTWDYGRGLITVDAPQVRAASGFLADAGPIDLGGVTIDSDIEYGTVTLVSLDDEPIGEGRMLLQVMSEMQNFGFETEDAGDGLKRITRLGGPPLLVREFGGTVRLDGSFSVTPLDADLAAGGEPVEVEGTITLESSTLYYLIDPN